MVALRVAVVCQHVHFNRLACRAFARVVACHRFDVAWRRGGAVVGHGHARRIADVTVNVGHGVFDRFRVASEARNRGEGDAAVGVHCPSAFAGHCQGFHSLSVIVQDTDAALVECVVALRISIVGENANGYGISFDALRAVGLGYRFDIRSGIRVIATTVIRTRRIRTGWLRRRINTGMFFIIVTTVVGNQRSKAANDRQTADNRPRVDAATYAAAANRQDAGKM